MGIVHEFRRRYFGAQVNKYSHRGEHKNILFCISGLDNRMTFNQEFQSALLKVRFPEFRMYHNFL